MWWGAPGRSAVRAAAGPSTAAAPSKSQRRRAQQHQRASGRRPCRALRRRRRSDQDFKRRTETVASGGTDDGALVSAGTQFDHGLASGATVFAGGVQVVQWGRSQRHDRLERRRSGIRRRHRERPTFKSGAIEEMGPASHKPPARRDFRTDRDRAAGGDSQQPRRRLRRRRRNRCRRHHQHRHRIGRRRL